MATSQNGYKANDRSVITTFPIPGTDRRVSLRQGAPGSLLAEFAARFDKQIESVDGGQLDDWGYAERNIRGSSKTLSNHASGTALDLNATKHPLGKQGTFTPGQVHRIQALLTEFEGAIRWGGNYHGRKDEMHFEIVVSPARCAEVLAKVRGAKPAAPAKKAAPVNHVTEGRRLIREGIAELRKTPDSRKAVHNRADEYAAVYKKGPSK